MEDNVNESMNESMQNQTDTTQNAGFNQTPVQNAGFNQAPVQNAYANEPATEQGKGFAIAGMVLGILSIVCCCFSYVSIVMAIIGMVLSIISLVKKMPGKGMAIAGVICSSVALVIVIIALIVAGSMTASDWQGLAEDLKREMNK